MRIWPCSLVSGGALGGREELTGGKVPGIEGTPPLVPMSGTGAPRRWPDPAKVLVPFGGT